VTSHRNRRVRARGFTLIEALVALIVLSIGLLGIAGMQISGLRANQSAASRTQASYLADDIADRMRANYTAARNGELPLPGFGSEKSGNPSTAADSERDTGS